MRAILVKGNCVLAAVLLRSSAVEAVMVRGLRLAREIAKHDERSNMRDARLGGAGERSATVRLNQLLSVLRSRSSDNPLPTPQHFQQVTARLGNHGLGPASGAQTALRLPWDWPPGGRICQREANVVAPLQPAASRTCALPASPTSSPRPDTPPGPRRSARFASLPGSARRTGPGRAAGPQAKSRG